MYHSESRESARACCGRFASMSSYASLPCAIRQRNSSTHTANTNLISPSHHQMWRAIEDNRTILELNVVTRQSCSECQVRYTCCAKVACNGCKTGRTDSERSHAARIACLAYSVTFNWWLRTTLESATLAKVSNKHNNVNSEQRERFRV